MLLVIQSGKGGKNKIGPALYNVVGRKVGEIADYKYSKALAAYDKEWSFEELNGFLIKPAKWIKGTKMAYAGLRKEKDRASVIKYLNQNSDNPITITLIFQSSIVRYFFEHELYLELVAKREIFFLKKLHH